MTFSTPQFRYLFRNLFRHLPQTFGLVLAVAISAAAHASEGEKTQILPSADNAKWRAECSVCHQLYHPALLPERSWRKMMGGLDRHFGKSVKLDAAVQPEITGFLVAHAAEHSKNNRAQKIAKKTQLDETPLRIEDTAFFNLHHNEIGADVWQRKAIGGKTNCLACHPEADKGNFDEKAIQIPR